MNKNPKTPFIIFIIALAITMAVFAIAVCYPILGWDKRNLIYLGFSQFLVAIITPIGIFAAFRARNNTNSKSKNNVWLWGNILLFVFTMSIAVYAIMTA